MADDTDYQSVLDMYAQSGMRNPQISYDANGKPIVVAGDAGLPVDVSTLQDYAATLPADNNNTNPLPTHYPYTPPPTQKAYDVLTGSNGQERYQLFPERIVRSALSLPTDVMSGKVATPIQQPAGGSEEDYSADPLLQRVQDMAALMGGGGVAGAERGAIGSGPMRNLYRGEYTGNKGGKFWTGDPEFAKQFTQTGQENELLRSSIDESHIYQPEEPVYAGDPDAVDKAVAEARGKGFKAVELNEGQGQPNSTYVFNKTALKGAILKSDNEAAAPIAAIENAPVFHSAVENAVNTSTLKSANPDQWLGTIKNAKGVKPEELDWTGLKDWLGEQSGPVSKEQVQGYLQQNKVGLGEVNKGAPSLQDKIDYLQSQGYDYEAATELAMKDFGGKDQTKYSKYQLPGGESYREKLLTLPDNQKWRITDQMDNSTVKTFNSHKEATDFYNNLDDETRSTYEIRSDNLKTDNSYKSSHWDEPNILAHIRMNDRTVEGAKALHIEEIQSDWHQQGREQGYKITPEQKQQLEGIENKLTSGLSEGDIGNPDMDAVLKTATSKGVITPAEAKNYKDWSKGENSTIPDAPFKKTWLDLALKRVIREAAETSQAKEVANWDNLVHSDPDKVAHALVKSGHLKEICE